MELTPRIYGAICFFILAFLIQAWSLVVETRETRTLGPLILSAAATCVALTMAFAPTFAPMMLPLGFVFAGVGLVLERMWRAGRRRQAEAAEAAAIAEIEPQAGLDIR